MNQSLTVVLPIHNAEATLHGSVEHVLEVAGELTTRVDVLIVDDGSTDDSFDIAREIASQYPQVRVIRQPQQRGLGPTLRNIQRRVKSDIVMVHDGVSATNAEQLRALWNRRAETQRGADVSIADLLRPAQNQAAMASAHSRLIGFQVVSTDDEWGTDVAPDAAMQSRQGDLPSSADVGAIPPLPRPNFLGAVGDFALGE